MELPNPVQLAIPGFIALVLAEVLLVRLRARPDYELRDTAASLLMGLGNFVSGFATGILTFAAMVWIHQFRLFDIGYQWWAFVGVFLLEDAIYYWWHRWSHERRFLWAAHVNHHSSRHYNLSTALRQTWTGFFTGGWVLWLILPLIGFPPPLAAFQKGVSLVYQFWIHTEAIGSLGPLEWILNTPRHHRIHHAVNPKYLDRNHAGILIIWDRMLGTFVKETEDDPCVYGLVNNLDTFNPLRIAFHEWWAMIADVLKPVSWRARLGYVFGPPGWSHDGSRTTSAQIRATALKV